MISSAYPMTEFSNDYDSLDIFPNPSKRSSMYILKSVGDIKEP